MDTVARVAACQPVAQVVVNSLRRHTPPEGERMPTNATKRLRARLGDASRLMEIHEECTGGAAGRRRGYDALNRSAIILAVAAWEGFVEELLEYAVGRAARNLKGPQSLPQNVREAMIAHLYEGQGWFRLTPATKASIWSLAGTGWRTLYIKYARDRIGALHTPNYTNVKKAFSAGIGLPNLADGWGATRWTPQDYITRIDALLQLRHRIAHGVLGEETVGKTKANAGIALVERLAGWSEKAVLKHLMSLDLTRPRSSKGSKLPSKR